MVSWRSSRSSPRSRRESAIRAGCAAILLWAGYVSITRTYAFAILKADPERAFALSPRDGRIGGILAEQQAVRKIQTGLRTDVTASARTALAREPLAVPALTALALGIGQQGDVSRTRQLFVHSDVLSRRELSARLWLIEDSVTRGDVSKALYHYDIALRTSRGAPEFLFPVLSAAIGDATIATALTATLASRPAWGDAFVYQLGNAGPNPDARAAFLRRLSASGYPVPEAARVGVIYALIAKGAHDDAWAFYATLRRGVSQGRSRDPDFTAQLQTPTAFDWTPAVNDAGISASIQHTNTGGLFEFSAPVTVSGVVLQQAQMLRPGRYRLEGVSSGIDQVREERPYWQLACSNGNDAGRIELPNSTTNGGRFAGEFTVRAGCAFQTLRLMVRPSSTIGGVSGELRRVLLSPVDGQ